MIAGHSSSRGLPFNTAVAAWYDHESDGLAICILLAAFVAAWTSFHTIAYSATVLHDDLLEVFVWSQHPAAGYSKQPPLAGLIATGWFTIFPPADWSFELLAMANSAIALFAVYLIARRYLNGDKRLLALLLLLLTPFYQFHSQRFSTNQTLLSTWPIATYCFLRAFESRGLAWSAAAGVTAALAMLGKYYSIYLIASFVIAALWHPRRWEYLRSPAPWVSILTGLAVLAPHLYWLMTTGPGPFKYAMAVHGSGSIAEGLKAALAYAAGGLAYVLLPVAVYLLALRPDRRVFASAMWPDDPDRRMLVLLLAAQLLLPMLTAPVIGIKLTSLWTMSAWFLLPIVLLGPPQLTLPRAAAVRVALGVAVVTVVVLAAAPVVAWIRYEKDSKNDRAYYRVLGKELTRYWRTAMQRPLTIVSGDLSVAQAVSFYSPNHPDNVPLFQGSNPPWITDARLAREGRAEVCFEEDRSCRELAERNTAAHSGVVRAEKELTISFFGLSRASVVVLFWMIPPQQ